MKFAVAVKVIEQAYNRNGNVFVEVENYVKGTETHLNHFPAG